jgi:uncharacterized membrane protein YphA (DoxX/SURF4 family)
METIAIPGSSAIRIWRPARGVIGLVVVEIIRVVIASVFLFAGLSKLRAPYDFLAAVYGYQLTGPFLSLVIAAVLPWLEVLVAICLWADVFRRGAMVVTMFLSTLFSIALACALYRQLDISCGCFSAEDKIGYFSLIRSLSLLAASAIGLMLMTAECKRSTS